jgi:hypothetical protein
MQRRNSGGITERLAGGVKGLTAVFCVLLLTDPAHAAPNLGTLQLNVLVANR